MTFQHLSTYLQQLEQTSSRLAITEILAKVYHESTPEESEQLSYLLLGSLAPQYKGVVFNIADKMMEEALAQAYGKTRNEIHALYKQLGDLGTVASELNTKNTSTSSVGDVYNQLVVIADYEGEGSQERKISGMAALLKELDAHSSRFVTRIPIGKLRLGFSEKTILDALSWMERGDKTGKSALEKAFIVLPDVGMLAKAVKEQGIEKAAKQVEPQIGIPVQPMLAQRLKSPKDMIIKMKYVAVEPKLDGLRILIHYKKGEQTKAFTRNMNEVGWMFPELERLGEQLNSEAAILDAEAIGMDETRKKLADFQTTMQRRRKHEVGDFSSKIPITFYVFDVIRIDNRNLMNETYLERRTALEKLIKPGNLIKVVEQELTDDSEKIAELQHQAVSEGLEGVMVKRTDSEYIPGRTGWRWVKMKEAELATGKLSDTVDAVIMGYTQGRGKRAAFGIGQFLAGVVDGETVKTVTKVGTGLSDEDFKELSKRLKKIAVKEMPKEYMVHKNLLPDYWVKPEVVVELAADDLTKSPNHTAGYALRFPRLVKFRDDKSVKESTTLKEIKKLYDLQFK